MLKYVIISFLLSLFCLSGTAQKQAFVSVNDGRFTINKIPYYYIGTNYWYGGLLSLQKDKVRGKERLLKELDFLKANGITNLRLVAGAEGEGLVNGVQRISPALQPEKGVFNESILDGLDFFLNELGKRNMKAVLFLSNNWEWSGGFLQYLHWNNQIPDSIFRRKLNWDEWRDQVSKFYTCTPCKADYLKQVDLLISRINSITKKKYSEDPTIMAWELANEPRPMRPAANSAYKNWIATVSAYIKSKDKNHLVTIGHEGDIALESVTSFYEELHALPTIDYLTIHIWPKNWAWLRADSMQTDFSQAVKLTNDYIKKHITVAEKLRKPLVIEEFGLPRDFYSFDISSSTTLRDQYYEEVFSFWNKSRKTNGVIAGANFWAFGGFARPKSNQIFWQIGDDYMGDPPMEEQGLYTVFDSDKSTWQLIRSYTKPNSRNKNNK